MRLRFGSFAEQFVADEYQIATGRRVVRHNAQLVHPDYPMAIGNVDRLVIPEGRKVAAIKGQIVADRILEAKTVGSHAKRDEWGQVGTDQVPTHYLTQSHWYLSLTPCAELDLAALFGAGEDLAIYTIKKDADLEEELLRRAAEWWRQHVENDVAPEPQSEADVRLLYPQDNQQQIDADEEIYSAFAQLCRVKEQLKALEADEQAARDTLTTFMRDAAVLRYQGATLATYKAASPSSKTDWKAVCKASGVPEDVIAQHTTETAGSRRLILK
jgi:predicted phage-related endonuclease